MTQTPQAPQERRTTPIRKERATGETEQVSSLSFAMLPARVLTAGLTHGAIVTYAHLVLRSGQRGYCWPSVAHLADALARPEHKPGGQTLIAPPHRNTVRAYLRELEEAGLIAIEENSGETERRRNRYRILPLPGLITAPPPESYGTPPPAQDAGSAQPVGHRSEERAQSTVHSNDERAQPGVQITEPAQPTVHISEEPAQPTVHIADGAAERAHPTVQIEQGYAHPTVHSGEPTDPREDGYAQSAVHRYAQSTVQEIYKDEIELRSTEALENRGGEGPPPEPSRAGAHARDRGPRPPLAHRAPARRAAEADTVRTVVGPIPMDATVQRRKSANRIATYLWEAQGRPARQGSDMEDLIEDVLRHLVVAFAGDPRKPTSTAVIEFITYAKTKPFFAADPSRLTPRNLAKDFGAWLDAGRPKSIEAQDAAVRRAARRTAPAGSTDGGEPEVGVTKYTSGKFGHLVET